MLLSCNLWTRCLVLSGILGSSIRIAEETVLLKSNSRYAEYKIQIVEYQSQLVNHISQFKSTDLTFLECVKYNKICFKMKEILHCTLFEVFGP